MFEGGRPRNVEIPVVLLDNDFKNPDVDRYLEKFEKYDPSVAILGDAYSRGEAETLDRVAGELLDEYPYKDVVIVPKHESVFDALSMDVTLGVANGYSEIQAVDLGLENFRGRDIHILGGSPHRTYDIIEKLTQPNLRGDEPANVKGLDWNGVHKVAYKGEYWSRSGWKRADHLSIRDTVKKSLEEVKMFWEQIGVWPDTEPIELYGSPVEKPDEFVFMDRGGDPIPDRESLEDALVRQYLECGKLAFESETEMKHWEYYENLNAV